ncbi:bifunctional hydroxymethylpyrimidine kinase/phosphomethylpyrimidine kinase, partial [Candidatus Woesearchaeota archaeon]|nr:bifunctional hydroxymethylpyrimidine kinase/phosphomethylpyrimidine kinase [Candidatus Woesearchaeota archaeon]
AIAANLALGCNLQDAVRRAVAYVHQALAAGYHVGASSVCVLKHRN